MGWLIAALAGTLVGGAVYSILQRDLHRVSVGIVLLTTAVNLVVYASGRLHHVRPVFVDATAAAPGSAAMGNPLPQAFVLTAIVIGLGVLAFLFVLVRVVDAERRDLDVDPRRDSGPGS